MVHLLPAMGHTTDPLDAGEIGFYRGSRGGVIDRATQWLQPRSKCGVDEWRSRLLVVIGLGE